MWVATILTVLPLMVFNHQFPWGKIFLNITTLFGFLAPGQYIPAGAWSIGNEMVYYAFTPLIIGLYNLKKMYGNIFTGASVVLGLLFSHYLMAPNIALGEQWHLLYINPFNNFFLYCIGVGIYYNLSAIRFSNWLCLLMISASALCFMFLPGEKQSIHLVTGNGRIIFVLLSILLTIGFYKFDPNIPRMIKAPFDLFGMATYSVYLLHPIIFFNISIVLRKAGIGSKGLLFATPCILTIIISIFTFYYFEKPFIKLGKVLTTSGTPNRVRMRVPLRTGINL